MGVVGTNDHVPFLINTLISSLITRCQRGFSLATLKQVGSVSTVYKVQSEADWEKIIFGLGFDRNVMWCCFGTEGVGTGGMISIISTGEELGRMVNIGIKWRDIGS